MKEYTLFVSVALVSVLVMTSAVPPERCYTRTIPNKKAVSSNIDDSIQYSSSKQSDPNKCRDFCEQDPTCRLVTFKKNRRGSNGICTKYFNKLSLTRISDPNYWMFEKICNTGWGWF